MKNPAALALVSSLAFVGCGTMYHFTGSKDVPAAEGTAKLTTNGANGNSRLAIKVQHLAMPDRVSPGAVTYVAWARQGEGSAATVQSLGALKVDKNLDGTLDTVTALRSFELFLTAESHPDCTSPEGPKVLVTHVATH